MSFKVAPCANLEEFGQAVFAIGQYFGLQPTEERVERFSKNLPIERMHAARENGVIVGGAGAFPFELTVPGGVVPTAGVTVVGTFPTHRRRGVLRAMMRAQLDDVHVRGEPVALLWASEDTIYSRFGYGIASFTAEIDLPREHSAYHTSFAPAGAARVVPLSEAEALVAPVWARVAAETPGMFARTSAWWQARALADPEWRRRGGGELQCVVLELGGRPTAYALYRLNIGFDRGVQTGAVDVAEAMGDSPEATAALWRYLLDIDWMPHVRAGLLPVDHPLLLLLAEPRRLRFSLRDGLWVRLVDVGAALSARTYAAAGSVVIDVLDRFCPWNEGRWRVSDGGAERVATAPELRCDVTALGSVYLGGFSWAQLVATMRVEERHPGAAARADALFRTPRAPWCPEIF